MQILKRFNLDFNNKIRRASLSVGIGVFLFYMVIICLALLRQGFGGQVWEEPHNIVRKPKGETILTAVGVANPLSPSQAYSYGSGGLNLHYHQCCLRARAFDERRDAARGDFFENSAARKVAELIDQLNKSEDPYLRAAAARDLGNLDQVYRYPDSAYGYWFNKATRALADHLIKDEGDKDDIDIVRRECARALGRLSRLAPLGLDVENCMLNALALEPGIPLASIKLSNTELSVRKEVVRAIAGLSHPSFNLRTEAPAILAHNIGVTEDVEMHTLIVEAIGNLGAKPASRVSLGFISPVIWNILCAISESAELGRTAQEFDGEADVEIFGLHPEVRRTAIRQLVNIVKSRIEFTRQEAISGSNIFDESGGFNELTGLGSYLTKLLFSILGGGLYEIAPAEADVRLEAAEGIRTFVRSTLLLTREITSKQFIKRWKLQKVQGWEFQGDQIKEIMAKRIGQLIYGDSQRRTEKNPIVIRVLLDMLAEFGDSKTVRHRDLISLLYDSNEMVCRQAENTMIKTGGGEILKEVRLKENGKKTQEAAMSSILRAVAFDERGSGSQAGEIPFPELGTETPQEYLNRTIEPFIPDEWENKVQILQAFRVYLEERNQSQLFRSLEDQGIRRSLILLWLYRLARNITYNLESPRPEERYDCYICTFDLQRRIDLFEQGEYKKHQLWKTRLGSHTYEDTDEETVRLPFLRDEVAKFLEETASSPERIEDALSNWTATLENEDEIRRVKEHLRRLLLQVREVGIRWMVWKTPQGAYDLITILGYEDFASGERMRLSSALKPDLYGSHAEVLIKAFPEMKLNRLDFGLNWDTKAQAIDNIRYRVSYFHPDLFARCEAWRMRGGTHAEHVRLIKDVVSTLSAEEIGRIGLRMTRKKEHAPYFESSHEKAIIASFPSLGLDVKDFRLTWMDTGKSGEALREEGISNVRHKFMRYEPELWRIYLRLEKKVGEGLEVSDTEVEAVQRLFSRISFGRLKKMGLEALFYGNLRPPYFSNTFDAIIQSFPAARLTLSILFTEEKRRQLSHFGDHRPQREEIRRNRIYESAI